MTAPQSAVCMRPSRGGLWVYDEVPPLLWQAIYHVSGHMANGVPPSSTPCLVFESSRWDDLVGKLSSPWVLLALGYYTSRPCSHYTCSGLKRACRGYEETMFRRTRDRGTLKITCRNVCGFTFPLQWIIFVCCVPDGVVPICFDICMRVRQVDRRQENCGWTEPYLTSGMEAEDTRRRAPSSALRLALYASVSFSLSLVAFPPHLSPQHVRLLDV